MHQSFPGPASTDELYHLGIKSILGNERGVLKGVDRSHHVGSPYFSLDSDINDEAGAFIQGEYQGNPTKRCLVYNKSTKLWERLHRVVVRRCRPEPPQSNLEVSPLWVGTA